MVADDLTPGQTIAIEQLEAFFKSRETHLREEIIAKRIPRELCVLLSVDDILQESWIDLCRECPCFRFRGVVALNNWLDEVVGHTLSDMVKAATRQKRLVANQRYAHDTSIISRFLSLASTRRTPSSEFAAVERSLQVQDAMRQLPEREKIVITMETESDDSQKTLAHSINQTEASFKSVLARGRLRLKRLLGRFQGGDRP